MASRRGPDRSPARGLALAGLAAGGVVIGHLLGYVLAFPDAAERHEHLTALGHGSFHRLVLLGLAATGLSLVAQGARALRGGGGVPAGRTALALASLQVPGFLVLELVERQFDPAVTMTDRGALIGLLVQVVVSLAIVLLLRAFVRAVRAAVALLRRRRPVALPVRLRRPVTPPYAGIDLLVGARRRAPPAPLGS